MNCDVLLYDVLSIWGWADSSLFVLLAAMSLSAWCRWDKLSWSLGSLALAVAVAIGRILLQGALFIVLFAALNGLWRHAGSGGSPRGKFIVLAHCGAAALLCLQKLPGFVPWQWLPLCPFRTDAAPAVAICFLETPFVGSMLLMNAPSPTADGAAALGRSLRAAIGPTVGTVAVLMVPALAFGYVRFDPQLHPLLPLWASFNLLLVVVHEEVLFRQALPEALQALLPAACTTPSLLLAMTAAAFGACHLAGGIVYAGLSTLAGLGYGLARLRTGRLEGAIMAHFCLNMVHFVTFTYPCLAQPK